MLDFRAGARFADRYELLAPLGAGGFGAVWRARDARLGTEVALKLLKVAGDAGLALRRFEREAQVLARLHHDGIVKVFDYGACGGVPYYAMELVEGETLDALMERSAVLAPAAVARIVRDASLALHHAHLAGVVHRDVKPQNILIQPMVAPTLGDDVAPAATIESRHGPVAEFRVVVTDFGLAKDQTAHTQLSASGEIMGTPHFMAPEQVHGRGDAIGPRTDVYGLGVVAYLLLSGALPFDGDTTPQVLFAITAAEPVAIERRAFGVPRDLAAIVTKAMAKAPAERYASALKLAEDCEAFLRGEPVAARATPWRRRLRRTLRRHRGPVAALTLAVAAGGGVGAWFGVVAPARRARAAARELAQAREAFAAARTVVEADARARLAAARARAEGGDGVGAADAATALGDALAPYVRTDRFPVEGFPAPWRPELAALTPFDVPRVDALLLAAESLERAGRPGAATRAYLRAHLAWREAHAATDPDTRLALGCFLLRTREFRQALHFLAQAAAELRTDDPRQRLVRAAIGFARGGAGDCAGAARTLREAAVEPPDAPLPSPGGAGPGVPGALWSLPLTAERLLEAAATYAAFATGPPVLPADPPPPLAAADLDGDGRLEVLRLVPAGVEVWGLADGALALQRVLAGPNAAGSGITAHDCDGDGRVELLLAVEDRLEIHRVGTERLERVAWTSSPDGVRWRGCIAGDLDGDGRPELLAGGHQRLGLFRPTDGGYAHVATRHFQSTEVWPIEFRDLDGDGRQELVAVSHTWSPGEGFRLWIFDATCLERGALAERQVRPIGMVGGTVHPVPGEPGGYLFATGTPGGLARPLRQIFERMGLPRRVGLFHVRHGPEGFPAPDLAWGTDFEAFAERGWQAFAWASGGRGLAVAHDVVRRDRRACSLAADGWPWVPLHDTAEGPTAPLPLLAADLDGDGDAELLLVEGGQVVVGGLPVPAAPAADAAPVGPPPDPRALGYQDTLLALAGDGRDGTEAGTADVVRFLERDVAPRFPEFRKDILRRVAEAHQAAGQWSAVLATIERLRREFLLAADESAELARWERWVGELLAQRDTVIVDFTDPPPLLVSAPFRFRLDRAAGVLRVVSNSRGPGFCAVPIASDERAQGVRGRFRVARLDYVNGFRVGIASDLRHLAPAWTFVAPPHGWGRWLSAFTAGMGGLPGATVSLYAAEVGGTEPVAELIDAPLAPGDAWFEFACQYVPPLGRFTATLTRQADGAATDLGTLRTRVAHRNPASDAFLVVQVGSTQYVGDAYHGVVDCARLSIQSAGGVARRPFEPATQYERFLRGGGRFAAGDWAGAIDDWAAVERALAAGAPLGIEIVPSDEVRREMAIASAAARWRLGDAATADAALAALIERDFEGCVQWAKRNAPGLLPDERAWFRRAFWAAAGLQGSLRVLNRMLPTSGTQPSAGLPLIEMLFAEEPARADVTVGLEEALDAFARDRRYASWFRRFAAWRLRHDGRRGEALAALDEARRQLDPVDEYDRVPMQRDIDAIREAWTRR